MCLCNEVRQLADLFDENEAKRLTSDLNKHLATIRAILGKSKALARDVRYQVVLNNQRTMKILSIRDSDITRANQIYRKYKDNIKGFWVSSNDLVHAELRRRLACVSIYLLSKMNAAEQVPPIVADLVRGAKLSELRYAGRKYIKIARKLGSIGSIIWLPLDVPASTYERYLSMDDEEAFAHLQLLGVNAPDYTYFVQHLVSYQLTGSGDPYFMASYYNMVLDYGDIMQRSDRLMLLLYALGGAHVPAKLLENVRLPKRRWNAEGEVEIITAVEFGLPSDLVQLLSDDNLISLMTTRPEVEASALEDGTSTWSIFTDIEARFSSILTSETEERLTHLALRLICFVTPPPLEGNTSWSFPMKKATWVLLEKMIERKRIPESLRTQVIESLLYFSERDSFPIRRLAISRARSLLKKTLPYYYHSSVTLFESILFRLDGNLVKSISKIQDFFATSQVLVTRLDNALKGRLHISLIETKIQHYDNDIASCLYGWEGAHPLSTLEIEVTRRLQGTAARFFQSIGDFPTARASLEQHLWLNSTKPIRHNTRLLIVGRLAEIYCELHEYEKATELLQPELDAIPGGEKKGRPYRRLLLARAEASIGQKELDEAESILNVLANIEPPALDDMNDQVLHMRRMIATARTAHEQFRYQDALRLWKTGLHSMEQLSIFRSKHPWTAALIYVSMAHAQLMTGDNNGGKQSWAVAVEISKSERCEYVIPVVADTWARKIVGEIHQLQGWPFRIMLPGGRPDLLWP
ncbi:hypothetical protein BGZ63DRAFT_518964 [Mariannaea sp. PMI_226]|nr:hypothetical protein BGZ63DRAFT_518964 [Mariannaea sp. PMI_226]